MKKIWMPLLQFAIGFALLAFILLRLNHSGQIRLLAQAFAQAAHNWPWILAGTSIFGGCIMLCVWRWQYLLRSVQVLLPLRTLTLYYFIGQFFNAFMFGATGGDVVKAYYVAQATQYRRTELFASVFIDRLIGLAALVVLIMAITLLRLKFFLATPIMRQALWMNIILVAAALAGAIVILVIEKRQPPPSAGPAAGRLMETLHRAYAPLRGCLRNRKLLAKVLCISCANHLGFIVAIMCLGRAVGIELEPVHYFTIFPVINAIAALPITPGGLGARDQAAIYLLGVVQVAAVAALTLSLLVYAATLFWSLAGGVVYLLYTWRSGIRVTPENVAAKA
jgi:hypothetical protein